MKEAFQEEKILEEIGTKCLKNNLVASLGNLGLLKQKTRYPQFLPYKFHFQANNFQPKHRREAIPHLLQPVLTPSMNFYLKAVVIRHNKSLKDSQLKD